MNSKLNKMNHLDGKFKGQKSLNIYYQAWIPDREIRAIILISHGFAEHSGRYLNIVHELIPLAYAVYAIDHRGHGNSEGTINYVESIDYYVEDLKKLFDIIREQYPKIPIFILGHSMGSGIAVNFTKKYESELSGLILSGIGSLMGDEISGFLKFIVKSMSRIAPKMKINPKLDPSTLSHDPEVVKAYIDDPLVHHTLITARLAYEMLKLFSNIGSLIKSFKLPTLVQRGAEDVAISGFEQIEADFSMEDKEIHIYEGLYHEVYNESKKDRTIVLNDLSNWLNNHIHSS
jgi:acylglycerol lipase